MLYFDHISSDPLSVPSLIIDRVTNSAVEYRVQTHDGTTNTVITGNKVTRFGVPMIGQYVNAGRRKTITISPAVPGALYRITAWEVEDTRRSATPAVVDATTGEASTMKYNCIELETRYIHASTSNYCSGRKYIEDSKLDYMSTSCFELQRF